MGSRPRTFGCTLVCSVFTVPMFAPCPVVMGDDGVASYGPPKSIESLAPGFRSAGLRLGSNPGGGPVETGNDYQLDDGTQETAIGTGGTAAIMWLTQYNVVAGLEVITDVNIAWGTVPNGSTGTVVLLSDPNGDGDPLDAVLLESLAVTVSDAGTDIVNKYNIPDTLIGVAGTSFFVGAFYQEASPPPPAQGHFPAAADQTVPVFGRNWIGFGTPTALPPVWTLLEMAGATPPSLASNWLVRANAIATATTCGANGCETPFEDCANCPIDCGACECGNGILEPGEECDPGGILGAPPNDAACPGTCLADCTCALITCTATCPAGAVLEGETCGADVNGGCNSGTCTGDGSACSAISQDCALGQGPCIATPSAFTALGSLGTGGSVDACGDDWAGGGTRDTDWYELTVVDTDGDGFADVSVTLSSEIPTSAFLISGATGDCSAFGGPPDVVLSVDCVMASFTACIAPGTYTVFVGASDTLGPVFDGFPCSSLEAPFEYSLNVSVADATCTFCGNGVCDVDEDLCTCAVDCGTPLANEGAGTCNDGIDNDCDGPIDCADPDCANLDGCPPTAIPTMTEWGLMTMIMLLLAAGTIVFARRRIAAA